MAILRYIFKHTAFENCENCQAKKQNGLQQKEVRIGLLTNSETLEEVKVTIRITIADIVQQTTTTRHHSKKATSCRIVFGVSSHVFRQAVDSLGQNCDLDVGRTVVLFVLLEFPNDFCFCFFRDGHTFLLTDYPVVVIRCFANLFGDPDTYNLFLTGSSFLSESNTVTLLHTLHIDTSIFTFESSPDDTDWPICAKKRNAGVGSNSRNVALSVTGYPPLHFGSKIIEESGLEPEPDFRYRAIFWQNMEPVATKMEFQLTNGAYSRANCRDLKLIGNFAFIRGSNSVHWRFSCAAIFTRS